MRDGGPTAGAHAVEFRGPKPDWLSIGLNAQPSFVVSGEERRLSGELAGRVSVRSIGHWPKGVSRPRDLPFREVWLPPYNVFLRHLLCVAVPSMTSLRSCFRAIMTGEWELTRGMKHMLGSRRALVVFSERDINAPFCVFDRIAGVDGMIDQSAYAAMLNRERDDPARPVMKALNRGYADALHYWSRHSLQSNMSVCDLDAFRSGVDGAAPLLIELKSSESSVAKLWLDDAPNLKLMEGLATEFQAGPPVVLRSQPSNAGNVGLFKIEEVSADLVRGSSATFYGRDERVALSWCVGVLDEIAHDRTVGDLKPFVLRRG